MLRLMSGKWCLLVIPEEFSGRIDLRRKSRGNSLRLNILAHFHRKLDVRKPYDYCILFPVRFVTARTMIKPRLAVSQNLWRSEEGLGALGALSAMDVEGLVISPSKIWEGFDREERAMSRFKSFAALLDGMGIEAIAMEGIIPVSCKGRIFGKKEIQTELLNSIRHACEIANTMKVETLTFNQPDLRHGSFCKEEEDFDAGVAFFADVSDIASEHSVRVVIEPCPQEYGCDFGCSLMEVSELLSYIDDPKGLGIHLNTSSLLLEEGMLKASVAAHGGTSHHVDVCDPFYRPLCDEDNSSHEPISAALSRLRGIGHGPSWVVVSGKRPRDIAGGAIVPRILEAVSCVRSIYLPDQSDSF